MIASVKIDYETYKVNMEINNMSFSAHVDAKGILSFIKHVNPKAVMLVHGEKVGPTLTSTSPR